MKRRRDRAGVPEPVRSGPARLAPLHLVRGLLLAALLLTPVVFVPGLVEGFEMPKAGLLRILGLGAALLLIGNAVRRRATLRPLDLAVLAWLGVELLASALSRAPWISLMGDRAQHEGLLTSTALAALYFTARATTRGDDDARGARDAFLIGISLSALYSLLQVLNLDPLGWQRTATYGAGAQLRPFGTLGHANMLGPITAAGAIAALVGVPGERSRRRVVSLAAGALLAAVTFVTLSRGAWLGAAAGGLIALALAGPRRWVPAGARGRAMAVAAAAIGLVVVALLVRAGWGGLVGQRLAEFLSPASGSSRSRLEIWRTALAMAADRPWIGQGPDTFTLRFPTFQSPDYWRFEWGGLPYHAHSIVLHLLATRGVAGLLAGAACLIAALAAARRALARGASARAWTVAWLGMAACLLVAGGFGAIGLTGALLLAVGAGTVGALADGPLFAEGESAASGGSAPAGAWITAAAVVMGLALWGTVTELRAERSATLAYLEVLASPADANLAYAVEASSRAAALMPQQDSYAQLHAQCLYGLALRADAPAGALASAETAARAAVRRRELRAANWQMLALVLGERAARGDRGAAEEAQRAWSRHRQLAPRDAAALAQEADLAVRLGRVADALELSRRAVALYPQDGPLLLRLSGAQGWSGDSLGAIGTLRRAARGEWHGDDQGRRTSEALLDSIGGFRSR